MIFSCCHCITAAPSEEAPRGDKNSRKKCRTESVRHLLTIKNQPLDIMMLWEQALPTCKKRGLSGRAFCNKKRGEEKMKKGEKSNLCDRPFRYQGGCLPELYGIIIPINY